MMVEKVRHFMERHSMATWGEPLWVGVSGGIDSMVLLHVLRTLRHECSVVHVDHGLRGSESDADHDLVEQYCERARIPFQGAKVVIGSKPGVSMQMAAREHRYAVFHQMIERGPKKMALAHHQDDAIETFFIQLMRGMGVHGWQSIPPLAGPFIRPLMNVGREEIVAYAREHQLAYREDASNTDGQYLRNRIRHELLPILESWRPGVRRSLARTIDLFREMDHIMQEHLDLALSGGTIGDAENRRISITSILTSGAPRALLYQLLRHHGFHPDRLEDIHIALEQGRTGTTFREGGVLVVIDREDLIITEIKEQARSWTIHSLEELPEDLPLTINGIQPQEVAFDQGATVAWLDKEKLMMPLQLRTWKAGDRMQPIGLRGTKLVSDILIDAKVPRNEKDHTHVLESNGRIVWLVGYRIGEGFQPDQASRQVLRLKWIG